MNIDLCVLYLITISSLKIFLQNERKRYSFSENTNLRINEYIDSLLDEVPRDFIEYSIPFKDGIERTASIHWGNKSCYIELFKETDDWQLNV